MKNQGANHKMLHLKIINLKTLSSNNQTRQVQKSYQMIIKVNQEEAQEVRKKQKLKKNVLPHLAVKKMKIMEFKINLKFKT